MQLCTRLSYDQINNSHGIHNYDLPISYIALSAGGKYICILKLTFEGNASINHSKWRHFLSSKRMQLKSEKL